MLYLLTTFVALFENMSGHKNQRIENQTWVFVETGK